MCNEILVAINGSRITVPEPQPYHLEYSSWKSHPERTDPLKSKYGSPQVYYCLSIKGLDVNYRKSYFVYWF